MSVTDILGTSCDQCRSMVQYSFTSTETRRLVRTDSSGRPPRLSHSSWTMKNVVLKASHSCRITCDKSAVSLLESGALYRNDQHQHAVRVSRFGLAVRRYAGKQRDLGSNPLRLSFLFKNCGLWTLSCDFVPHNQWNIKIALITAHLNAGVILVVTV